MPIYEYQCEACGHQFDIIQKISDDKLTVCPKCNEHKLKKLVRKATEYYPFGPYLSDGKKITKVKIKRKLM